MCDIDNNRDDYGFERPQNDNSVGSSYGFPQISSRFLIITIVVIVVLLITVGILLMGGSAWYYSWYEFPSDTLSNKLVKSSVAFMFSPFYLIYTLAKLKFFSAKG